MNSFLNGNSSSLLMNINFETLGNQESQNDYNYGNQELGLPDWTRNLDQSGNPVGNSSLSERLWAHSAGVYVDYFIFYHNGQL